MLKIVAPLLSLMLLGACSSGDSEPNTSTSDTSTSVGQDSGSSTSYFLDNVPASMNQLLEENSPFSIFAELVALTDLAPLFDAEGEITVFIPPNPAFEKLPAGTVDKLKDPKNKDVLTRLISYHMLDGMTPELEIVTGILTMKSGDDVQVEVGDKPGYLMNIKMNGIPVAVGDMYAGKSVAHLLNDILVPEGLDLSAL